MKSPSKIQGADISDVVISIDVDSELIESVRNGEIDQIALEINEQNQNSLLENIDGKLVLSADGMPTTNHDCHFYNGGEFPFILKKSLSALVLVDGDNYCLTHIISKEVEACDRVRSQSPNVPDPIGDRCIWEVNFEIIPVLDKPKIYLMRWNPTISSFKEQDYKQCVENMQDGIFRMNWSIYEWEEARRSDLFYMLRVGDEKAGIVFNGYFVSDPYVEDDWAGSTKRRCYVDMICQNVVAPEEDALISLKKLKEAIPDYDWEKGHSGELLPEEVCEKLNKLWKE